MAKCFAYYIVAPGIITCTATKRQNGGLYEETDRLLCWFYCKYYPFGQVFKQLWPESERCISCRNNTICISDILLFLFKIKKKKEERQNLNQQ